MQTVRHKRAPKQWSAAFSNHEGERSRGQCKYSCTLSVAIRHRPLTAQRHDAQTEHTSGSRPLRLLLTSTSYMYQLPKKKHSPFLHCHAPPLSLQSPSNAY